MAIQDLIIVRSNDGKLYKSSDNVNFTQITTLPINDRIYNYCYNSATKEIWCVFGGSGSTAYVSTDLETWTAKTLPFTNVRGILYAQEKGTLIVYQNQTSGSSQIAISTNNGSSWTTKTSVSGSVPFDGFCYLPNEDTYVRGSTTSFARSWYYSDDLITWTTVTSTIANGSNYTFSGYGSINKEQYDNGYYCIGFYYYSSSKYNIQLYKISSMKTGAFTKVYGVSSSTSSYVEGVATTIKPLKFGNYIIYLQYKSNKTIGAFVYNLGSSSALGNYTLFTFSNSLASFSVNGIDDALIYYSYSNDGTTVYNLMISNISIENNTLNVLATNEISNVGIGMGGVSWNNGIFSSFYNVIPISIGKNILKFNGQKVIKINNQKVSMFNGENIFPPKEQ